MCRSWCAAKPAASTVIWWPCSLDEGPTTGLQQGQSGRQEPLFDAIDTVKGSLRVFADMMPAVQPRRERLREAALAGFSTATVWRLSGAQDVAFRDAHEIVAGGQRGIERAKICRNYRWRTAVIFRGRSPRMCLRRDPGRLGAARDHLGVRRRRRYARRLRGRGSAWRALTGYARATSVLSVADLILLMPGRPAHVVALT